LSTSFNIKGKKERKSLDSDETHSFVSKIEVAKFNDIIIGGR
jgi:hypothetical protein